MPTISKSKFLNALQCPLLLWTQFRDRDAIPEPGPAQQAIFDTGHAVGDLAKDLYPDGVEVDFAPHGGGPTLQDTVTRTAELLAERRPIFEASFLVPGPPAARYVRVDILVPAAGDAWDLYEVKSGTKVKPVNVWDVAYQTDTLERAGVLLDRLHLMHVDNRYVRDGNIDPAGLFHAADITAEARDLAPRVPDALARAAAVIAGERPVQPIGSQCKDPFPCPLYDSCWGSLPPNHVTEIRGAGKKAFTWMAEGFETIDQLPDDRLTPNQWIQKASLDRDEMIVVENTTRELRARLQYPLWHLDFETAGPAVPLFDGTRPYQAIPFQFSLHVQEAEGSEPRHVEFLHLERDDPRPALIEALQAIGPEGTVLAFNAGFEARVLLDLAGTDPGHREFCEGLVGRLVDLADPFRKWQIYHPAQRGSFSLKAVLPALTGRGYEDLEIADGQAAGREWMRVVHGDVEDGEKARVAGLLRDYCGRDTGAMVELLGVVLGRS